MRTNESSDFSSVMNSSISITSYYFIQTSDELSRGIFFTNYTGAQQNKQYPLSPGTKNNNAIWNYNSSTGRTEYWVYIFVFNTYIDICHGATNHLCTNPGCTGANNYMITINNTKWSKSFNNDNNQPSLANSIPFVLGFDNTNKIVEGIDTEKTIYFRYWLDVPANSSASVYNTTYQIMTVASGYEC